jgi:hypothetical protein
MFSPGLAMVWRVKLEGTEDRPETLRRGAEVSCRVGKAHDYRMYWFATLDFAAKSFRAHEGADNFAHSNSDFPNDGYRSTCDVGQPSAALTRRRSE